MVLQCPKLFFYKVSSEVLRQDSQSSYSFGKIQNVGETELSEEKNVSLEKDFIFRFHIYFSASFAFYFLVSYIYIYIYISKDIYNNALFNSGFKQKIKFDPNFGNNNSQNKNSKRNIIWFNPPYSNNVLTNIGKICLTILDKHFPKSQTT